MIPDYKHLDVNIKGISTPRDGQAGKKTTVLGDRARVLLQNRKRELLAKVSRLKSLKGLNKKRSKQPYVVRLYMTLVRTEFDSARVHSIIHFRIAPLLELAKILFGGAKIIQLSVAKKLIKNYTQIGLAISLRDRELLKSVSEGLESVVQRFGTIYSETSPLRRSRNGSWNTKKKKFRKHALELTSFKKIVILDPNRENDTKESSISKWRQVIANEGATVADPQKNHFRKKVRQLLRCGGFRHQMYDCLGSIPSRSSTYTFPAGDFPTGGNLTEYQSLFATRPTAPIIVTEKGIEHPGAISTLFRDSLLDPCAKNARVVSVSDTFKDRILTIHPGHQQLLTGLQQSLLRWLGNLEAFFVGKDSTDELVFDLAQRNGGLFCSGDYSQATDTFSSDLTEIVLEEIVECIDFHIDLTEEELEMLRNYIIQSCTRWQLTLPNGEVIRQRRGQLMGTVLSFPVLNIYNFAAFACLFEEYHRCEVDLDGLQANVRINGDDILFHESIEFIRYWMEGVSRYGMSLNKAKSSISEKYCSLNSQYYYCTREGFLQRLRREQVYLLNTEAGFDRTTAGFTIHTVVSKARALFNLGAWKALNLWFRLHAIEHVEFRRFFGPLTEDAAERQSFNIERNLMENAKYMAGQSLYLDPQELICDKSPVEDREVIDREMKNIHPRVKKTDVFDEGDYALHLTHMGLGVDEVSLRVDLIQRLAQILKA